MVAAERVLRLGVLGRDVARRLVLLEVRSVQSRPLALLVIPPDELLALRPRTALRVGGSAVVEDAAVVGPRPGPLGRDVVLLPVGLLAGGLVDPVLEAAAGEPAAADGRAIVLQLGVAVEERPARDLQAALRLQHGFPVRLLQRR